MAEIERYCRQDVALLRDLLQYAERHGHLMFRTRSGQRVRLPAPWNRRQLVEQAQRVGPPSRGEGRRAGARRQRAEPAKAAPRERHPDLQTDLLAPLEPDLHGSAE